MEIRRSALIERSAASTFDVIEAAEQYPEFLPWCANAVILERDQSIVAARISVNYHGVRFDFTTRNPKRRPTWLAVHLEEGPFRRFEGEWHLTALAADACKIEFMLHYEVASTLLGKVAGSVFDAVANTLVDAFARRAQQLPLEPPPEPELPSVPSHGDP
ncbi:MAG TPA: type II toxin-antitoxin system RatA family toxin [Casimicrobiaceae bacterium]